MTIIEELEVDMGWITFLLGVAGTFLRWWIILVFYGWFILPVFDLPELRYVEMGGVSMFISLVTYTLSWDDIEKHDDEALLTKTCAYIFMYLTVWLIGYIVHLCY